MKLVVIVAVLVCSVPLCLGCSCSIPFASLQESFCTADFVIKAKVTSERIPVADEGAYYKIKIIGLYMLDGVDNFKLYTPREGGGCGIYLDKKTYIFAGKIDTEDKKPSRLRVRFCDFYKQWDLLSRGERKFLRKEATCQ